MPYNNYLNRMMTVITRVNKLFLSLALLSKRTLATTTFFLSCIGFFDQWLIGGILDGCVAIIWAGKAHVRCVPVYITMGWESTRPLCACIYHDIRT